MKRWRWAGAVAHGLLMGIGYVIGALVVAWFASELQAEIVASNTGVSISRSQDGTQRATMYADVLWLMPYDGIPPDLNTGALWLNGKPGCNRVMVNEAGGPSCATAAACPQECFQP